MRQSQFFAPTLRQVKADNEGHALLLRGAYIRQLGSGIYSYLPLGWRVLQKIQNIVRQEMDKAGGVELLMPALHPAEIWAETGRDKMDILFRLKDGRGTDMVLGPTHEEIVTDIVRAGISSYKQLPVTLYQIQAKFRDEPRPRAGLLRGREFVMKDAYSFDADIAGLDRSFDAMMGAYRAIFARCGLDFQVVDASGGGIGGFDTKEFMTISPSGEDTILFNEHDGYAANLELATSTLEPIFNRNDISGELEEFATPGITTIEQLANSEGGAEAKHQIKTLVYVADEQPVLLLLRGDHQLNEAKAAGILGASALRAATGDEIFALLGAHPGSLGAVNLGATGAKLRIFADATLENRQKMTTGANKDGFHLRGVDVARDISVEQFADLREAREGETSPRGGGALQSAKCIEIGHVFKLGNKYSKAMGATFLDQNGKAQIFEMGCYGIGVSRIMAAVVEGNSDERGPIWPAEIAPFAVHILLMDKDEATKNIAEKIYFDLQSAGVEVLFDDRNERPGAKFADADLFGIPTQIVVGKLARESGEVEIRSRKDKSSENLSADEVVARVRESAANL
ncbi:prolyl-tRNA synthetase [Abditibacterium utsteinense]|uniref:Proline--tRNA ligase n=1 Tax=Abditibacterium utsteinense TaxID=1960156 RepID=A0A2S8SWV8_9BACT|nr:proline--tRNA ligase [Abditibacterium utsteinense]PQV65285.1 prolyl-tRNA synthetase [Abditibacterium utsteinense]